VPKLSARKGPKVYGTAQPIPRRVSKDYEPSHCYSDGKGGVWTHRGRSRQCRKPECVQWWREQDRARPPLVRDEPAPRGYSEEPYESWTEDAGRTEPYRGPAGENCPRYGQHRWTWGDDDNGHSGDVCECGAYQPG
jgi:hypothetical protein